MTTIETPDVPLAGIPEQETGDHPEEVVILDEDIPLAGLPKTGKTGSPAGVLFLLSSMLLAVDGLLKKKREV